MKSKVLKPSSRTSWFSHSRSSLAVWEEEEGAVTSVFHRRRTPRLHTRSEQKIPPPFLSPRQVHDAHEHQHQKQEANTQLRTIS